MKGKTFNDILKAATDEPLRRVLAKVPQWAGVSGLIVPDSLSSQQCSSAGAALYKADLAARATVAANFAQQSPNARLLRGEVPQQSRIADLTGGLGVDSWAFSKVFGEVLYCERNTELYNAACNNFSQLGCSNIRTMNCTVDLSFEQTLKDFAPDIIYLDPARRDACGKKVFLLEDCEPDLIALLPMLQRVTSRIMVKVSPMADISMLRSRLGDLLQEIHIVQVDGEAKELLLLCATVTAIPPATVARAATVACITGVTVARTATVSVVPPVTVANLATVARGAVLFEPGPGLSKAGAYGWICERFGAQALGRDAHLFILKTPGDGDINVDDPVRDLLPFGKTFLIMEVLPLNNKEVKDIVNRYPRAEVSSRGLKMTSDQLREKLKVRSGGDIHIFGVATPQGNLLIVGKVQNYD